MFILIDGEVAQKLFLYNIFSRVCENIWVHIFYSNMYLFFNESPCFIYEGRFGIDLTVYSTR